MNQLTNEETAKVFAMYWGSEILISQNDQPIIEKVQGSLCYSSSLTIWSCQTGYNTKFFKVKLLLKPLSSISDEDAVEVARLANYLKLKTKMAAIGRDVINSLIGKTHTYHYSQPFAIFQYLISKGYAVPLFFGVNHWANGKNAFELNIAIEKTS